MTEPHPRRRYLKGDTRAQLAAALKTKYEAGATIRTLAAETGYSFGNVADLLRLAGTEMRPKGFQRKA